MKSTLITIPGSMDGMNEFIGAMQKHRLVGAEMKKQNTNLARLAALRAVRFDTPVRFVFTWFEKDAKRDPDNVVFAKKFILDGLVAAKVIPNDTRRWVRGWRESVETDSANPRIEILITEVQ